MRGYRLEDIEKCGYRLRTSWVYTHVSESGYRLGTGYKYELYKFKIVAWGICW